MEWTSVGTALERENVPKDARLSYLMMIWSIE